ncbi:MAG TPA: hypothetical protein VM432_01505 [Bdellovibrionales bacterium]|nr:hypothetical protein [Bdellovibrionales bacterium]
MLQLICSLVLLISCAVAGAQSSIRTIYRFGDLKLTTTKDQRTLPYPVYIKTDIIPSANRFIESVKEVALFNEHGITTFQYQLDAAGTSLSETVIRKGKVVGQGKGQVAGPKWNWDKRLIERTWNCEKTRGAGPCEKLMQSIQITKQKNGTEEFVLVTKNAKGVTLNRIQGILKPGDANGFAKFQTGVAPKAAKK